MRIPKEPLFRQLVEEVRNYSILVIDTKGTIIFWNEGAQRFFGYTEQEAVGQNFSMLYTEREKKENVPEEMMNEAKRNKKSEREGWRIRKDKSEFWGKVVLASLHDEENNLIGFSKITSDMTSIRLAHQIKLDRKDEILALLTHELKNPLATISAYSELSSKLEPGNCEKAVDYSGKIFDITQKLISIINELYQANQNEAESTILNLSTFDLCKVVRDVCEAMQLANKTHRFKISGCKQPIIVNADKRKIEQVLNNYISNGIKYSPGAERLDINISPNDKEVIVGVKDYGIGVPTKQIPKLFEKYQRANNTGKIEGLGLGLYLCKGIIYQHKGDVWIKSEQGKGSTFYFSLPTVID